MTEVASLLPADHRLASVRHYEAGPPVGLELVEPGETFATTKEEEWVSKKKTEVTNTKQIETRVKRQVVLEDGKVVEDTGPMVTSNTTEDTETHEHHQTELRKLGDDEDDQKAIEDVPDGAIVEKSNWVSVANPDGVVREVKERRVVSREETEEVKETEDIQHLGDITDEQFLAAVRSGKSDLRQVLRSSEAGRALVSTGPRLIRDTNKSNKVIDTEDTRELSSVLPNGKIVTETQRTTEHEEINDDECPDDVPDQDYEKESSQRFKKTREQEEVDYLKNGVNVGHEMRFKTETMEVERRGDGMDEIDFDSLSARVRRRTNNIRSPPNRYRGISEWSERRQQEHYSSERRSPLPYHRSPSPVVDHPRRFSPAPDYRHHQHSPIPDYRTRHSPDPDYRTHHSPVPDYRTHSPTPDYNRSHRISPKRDVEIITPTPPQRKRTSERQQRQRVVEERTRYDSGYRSRRDDSRDRMEEPPPDYSPPSPPPMPIDKKHSQKTRFAADPPKQKSGNIIGQSIRKLVGKIRSASAERKARQRAKRSPSPSYQQGHVIDNNIGHNMDRPPVQRYYLGEDPFAGSIYGRENKYDGVKPARSSRKPREEDRRSQSTLGRFSKSTGRLVNSSVEERNSQTLPRHLSSKHEVPTRLERNNRSNSTINVSIINTVSQPRNIVNDGPAKPARTYKSNLSRSKSLNVHAEDLNSRNMYTSNPQVHRLDEKNIGLKSPGLISSLNRSPDVSEEVYTSRFSTTRNGTSETTDNKRVFMSNLKDRAPELFKTLHEDDTDSSWKPSSYSTPVKTITTTTTTRNYNGDIYEPPTRLRDTQVFSSPQQSVIRRGSNSSNDFSETYHTTKRNDDPLRPSVTNTTTSVSKRTIPGKDGRSLETIESKETRSVTKSSYRGNEPIKYYETERRYSSSGSNPVVIEVRNYRK